MESRDNYYAPYLKMDSKVNYPFQMVLPNKLNDFLIKCLVKPMTSSDGYIFTVMNPMETIIQLGVHLSQVVNEMANVTLFYTDVRSGTPSESNALASFEVTLTNEWLGFAFKVVYDELIFYQDCEEIETRKIVRDPPELELDSASTLYIGQAGDKLKGNFQVSGTFLLHNSPTNY